MPDAKYKDNEANKETLLAAFNSLDMSDIKNPHDLARKLTRRAVTLSKILSPESLEMKTLNSIKIPAKLSKMEFEETSKRWVATFVAFKGDGSTETIRSARMDSFEGEVVEPNINAIRERLAKDGEVAVLIYKYNEKSGQSRTDGSGGIVPQQGYRNFIWIDTL